jgi:hypothetical protein
VPDRRARQSRMEIANLLWPISSLLSVVKH